MKSGCVNIYYPWLSEVNTLRHDPVGSRAGMDPRNGANYTIIHDPDERGGFRKGAQFARCHLRQTLVAKAFTIGTIMLGPGTEDTPGQLYKVAAKKDSGIQYLRKIDAWEAPKGFER